MTPFAIAGIQMRVSATESNVEAMRIRLDTLWPAMRGYR